MVKTGEEEKRVTGKQREEITEAWEVVVVKMYLKYWFMQLYHLNEVTVELPDEEANCKWSKYQYKVHAVFTFWIERISSKQKHLILA